MGEAGVVSWGAALQEGNLSSYDLEDSPRVCGRLISEPRAVTCEDYCVRVKFGYGILIHGGVVSRGLLDQVLFQLRNMLIEPIFLVRRIFVYRFRVLVSRSALIFLIIQLAGPFCVLLILLILLVFLVFRVFLETVEMVAFVVLLDAHAQPY